MATLLESYNPLAQKKKIDSKPIPKQEEIIAPLDKIDSSSGARLQYDRDKQEIINSITKPTTKVLMEANESLIDQQNALSNPQDNTIRNSPSSQESSKNTKGISTYGSAKKAQSERKAYAEELKEKERLKKFSEIENKVFDDDGNFDEEGVKQTYLNNDLWLKDQLSPYLNLSSTNINEDDKVIQQYIEQRMGLHKAKTERSSDIPLLRHLVDVPDWLAASVGGFITDVFTEVGFNDKQKKAKEQISQIFDQYYDNLTQIRRQVSHGIKNGKINPDDLKDFTAGDFTVQSTGGIVQGLMGITSNYFEQKQGLDVRGLPTLWQGFKDTDGSTTTEQRRALQAFHSSKINKLKKQLYELEINPNANKVELDKLRYKINQEEQKIESLGSMSGLEIAANVTTTVLDLTASMADGGLGTFNLVNKGSKLADITNTLRKVNQSKKELSMFQRGIETAKDVVSEYQQARKLKSFDNSAEAYNDYLKYSKFAKYQLEEANKTGEELLSRMGPDLWNAKALQNLIRLGKEVKGSKSYSLGGQVLQGISTKGDWTNAIGLAVVQSIFGDYTPTVEELSEAAANNALLFVGSKMLVQKYATQYRTNNLFMQNLGLNQANSAYIKSLISMNNRKMEVANQLFNLITNPLFGAGKSILQGHFRIGDEEALESFFNDIVMGTVLGIKGNREFRKHSGDYDYKQSGILDDKGIKKYNESKGLVERIYEPIPLSQEQYDIYSQRPEYKDIIRETENGFVMDDYRPRNTAEYYTEALRANEISAENATVKDVLPIVEKMTGKVSSQSTIDMLKEKASDIPIRVDALDITDEAIYDPNNREIVLNLNATPTEYSHSLEALEEAVVHEGVHSTTIDAYDNDADFKMTVDEMTNAIMEDTYFKTTPLYDSLTELPLDRQSKEIIALFASKRKEVVKAMKNISPDTFLNKVKAMVGIDDYNKFLKTINDKSTKAVTGDIPIVNDNIFTLPGYAETDYINSEQLDNDIKLKLTELATVMDNTKDLEKTSDMFNDKDIENIMLTDEYGSIDYTKNRSIDRLFYSLGFRNKARDFANYITIPETERMQKVQDLILMQKPNATKLDITKARNQALLTDLALDNHQLYKEYYQDYNGVIKEYVLPKYADGQSRIPVRPKLNNYENARREVLNRLDDTNIASDIKNAIRGVYEGEIVLLGKHRNDKGEQNFEVEDKINYANSLLDQGFYLLPYATGDLAIKLNNKIDADALKKANLIYYLSSDGAYDTIDKNGKIVSDKSGKIGYGEFIAGSIKNKKRGLIDYIDLDKALKGTLEDNYFKDTFESHLEGFKDQGQKDRMIALKNNVNHAIRDYNRETAGKGKSVGEVDLLSAMTTAHLNLINMSGTTGKNSVTEYGNAGIFRNKKLEIKYKPRMFNGAKTFYGEKGTKTFEELIKNNKIFEHDLLKSGIEKDSEGYFMKKLKINPEWFEESGIYPNVELSRLFKELENDGADEIIGKIIPKIYSMMLGKGTTEGLYKVSDGSIGDINKGASHNNSFDDYNKLYEGQRYNLIQRLKDIGIATISNPSSHKVPDTYRLETYKTEDGYTVVMDSSKNIIEVRDQNGIAKKELMQEVIAKELDNIFNGYGPSNMLIQKQYLTGNKAVGMYFSSHDSGNKVKIGKGTTSWDRLAGWFNGFYKGNTGVKAQKSFSNIKKRAVNEFIDNQFDNVTAVDWALRDIANLVINPISRKKAIAGMRSFNSKQIQKLAKGLKAIRNNLDENSDTSFWNVNMLDKAYDKYLDKPYDQITSSDINKVLLNMLIMTGNDLSNPDATQGLRGLHTAISHVQARLANAAYQGYSGGLTVKVGTAKEGVAAYHRGIDYMAERAMYDSFINDVKAGKIDGNYLGIAQDGDLDINGKLFERYLDFNNDKYKYERYRQQYLENTKELLANNFGEDGWWKPWKECTELGIIVSQKDIANLEKIHGKKVGIGTKLLGTRVPLDSEASTLPTVVIGISAEDNAGVIRGNGELIANMTGADFDGDGWSLGIADPNGYNIMTDEDMENIHAHWKVKMPQLIALKEQTMLLEELENMYDPAGVNQFDSALLQLTASNPLVQEYIQANLIPRNQSNNAIDNYANSLNADKKNGMDARNRFASLLDIPFKVQEAEITYYDPKKGNQTAKIDINNALSSYFAPKAVDSYNNQRINSKDGYANLAGYKDYNEMVKNTQGTGSNIIKGLAKDSYGLFSVLASAYPDTHVLRRIKNVLEKYKSVDSKDVIYAAHQKMQSNINKALGYKMRKQIASLPLSIDGKPNNLKTYFTPFANGKSLHDLSIASSENSFKEFTNVIETTLRIPSQEAWKAMVWQNNNLAPLSNRLAGMLFNHIEKKLDVLPKSIKVSLMNEGFTTDNQQRQNVLAYKRLPNGKFEITDLKTQSKKQLSLSEMFDANTKLPIAGQDAPFLSRADGIKFLTALDRFTTSELNRLKESEGVPQSYDDVVFRQYKFIDNNIKLFATDSQKGQAVALMAYVPDANGHQLWNPKPITNNQAVELGKSKMPLGTPEQQLEYIGNKGIPLNIKDLQERFDFPVVEKNGTPILDSYIDIVDKIANEETYPGFGHPGPFGLPSHDFTRGNKTVDYISKNTKRALDVIKDISPTIYKQFEETIKSGRGVESMSDQEFNNTLQNIVFPAIIEKISKLAEKQGIVPDGLKDVVTYTKGNITTSKSLEPVISSLEKAFGVSNRMHELETFWIDKTANPELSTRTANLYRTIFLADIATALEDNMNQSKEQQLKFWKFRDPLSVINDASSIINKRFYATDTKLYTDFNGKPVYLYDKLNQYTGTNIAAEFANKHVIENLIPLQNLHGTKDAIKNHINNLVETLTIDETLKGIDIHALDDNLLSHMDSQGFNEFLAGNGISSSISEGKVVGRAMVKTANGEVHSADTDNPSSFDVLAEKVLNDYDFWKSKPNEEGHTFDDYSDERIQQHEESKRFISAYLYYKAQMSALADHLDRYADMQKEYVEGLHLPEGHGDYDLAQTAIQDVKDFANQYRSVKPQDFIYQTVSIKEGDGYAANLIEMYFKNIENQDAYLKEQRRNPEYQNAKKILTPNKIPLASFADKALKKFIPVGSEIQDIDAAYNYLENRKNEMYFGPEAIKSNQSIIEAETLAGVPEDMRTKPLQIDEDFSSVWKGAILDHVIRTHNAKWYNMAQKLGIEGFDRPIEQIERNAELGNMIETAKKIISRAYESTYNKLSDDPYLRIIADNNGFELDGLMPDANSNKGWSLININGIKKRINLYELYNLLPSSYTEGHRDYIYSTKRSLNAIASKYERSLETMQNVSRAAYLESPEGIYVDSPDTFSNKEFQPTIADNLITEYITQGLNGRAILNNKHNINEWVEKMADDSDGAKYKQFAKPGYLMTLTIKNNDGTTNQVIGQYIAHANINQRKPVSVKEEAKVKAWKAKGIDVPETTYTEKVPHVILFDTISANSSAIVVPLSLVKEAVSGLPFGYKGKIAKDQYETMAKRINEVTGDVVDALQEQKIYDRHKLLVNYFDNKQTEEVGSVDDKRNAIFAGVDRKIISNFDTDVILKNLESVKKANDASLERYNIGNIATGFNNIVNKHVAASKVISDTIIDTALKTKYWAGGAMIGAALNNLNFATGEFALGAAGVAVGLKFINSTVFRKMLMNTLFNTVQTSKHILPSVAEGLNYESAVNKIKPFVSSVTTMIDALSKPDGANNSMDNEIISTVAKQIAVYANNDVGIYDELSSNSKGQLKEVTGVASDILNSFKAEYEYYKVMEGYGKFSPEDIQGLEKIFKVLGDVSRQIKYKKASQIDIELINKTLKESGVDTQFDKSSNPKTIFETLQNERNKIDELYRSIKEMHSNIDTERLHELEILKEKYNDRIAESLNSMKHNSNKKSASGVFIGKDAGILIDNTTANQLQTMLDSFGTWITSNVMTRIITKFERKSAEQTVTHAAHYATRASQLLKDHFGDIKHNDPSLSYQAGLIKFLTERTIGNYEKSGLLKTPFGRAWTMFASFLHHNLVDNTNGFLKRRRMHQIIMGEVDSYTGEDTDLMNMLVTKYGPIVGNRILTYKQERAAKLGSVTLGTAIAAALAMRGQFYQGNNTEEDIALSLLSESLSIANPFDVNIAKGVAKFTIDMVETDLGAKTAKHHQMTYRDFAKGLGMGVGESSTLEPLVTAGMFAIRTAYDLAAFQNINGVDKHFDQWLINTINTQAGQVGLDWMTKYYFSKNVPRFIEVNKPRTKSSKQDESQQESSVIQKNNNEYDDKGKRRTKRPSELRKK